uniref:Uncharacterized protein n=1 Tax=Peronospora matthiolae TaxID=2874970 RepID=A0AAV1TTG9_9STRA
MEGRGTAQEGHAEEKSKDRAPPVDQAAALARVLKMLIDSRFGQIDARQNGSSCFGSASKSPPLPADVPHTAPRGQGPATIGRATSELGGGLTLNELGDSGFGAKNVLKGRGENTPIGRHSVYKSPNMAPSGTNKIPKLVIDNLREKSSAQASKQDSSSEGTHSSRRSRWTRFRFSLRGENASK